MGVVEVPGGEAGGVGEAVRAAVGIKGGGDGVGGVDGGDCGGRTAQS